MTTETVPQKLSALKYILFLPPPSATMVPFEEEIRSDSETLISIKGVIPTAGKPLDKKFMGALPEDVTLENAQEAARLCTVNMIAILGLAVNQDFDRLQKIIALHFYIASDAGFEQHAQIADSGTQLVYDLFGDRGKHTRAVTGASSLPLGACAELVSRVRIKNK